jgi:glycosyltransferase involved in cell wall biosynthesis
MKITFISFSSFRGGAGKAASRISKAVTACGVEVSMVSTDDEVYKKTVNFIDHYLFLSGWVISHLLTKLMRSRNQIKHSLNIFGNAYIRNAIESANLLHIHWINNEVARIKDFHLFSGKSIITLHDEWFYCGTEHYALEQSDKARFIEGYTAQNKDVSSIDLNRIIWELKKKYYQDIEDVIFTVPSTWLRNRAISSYLMKNMDVRVIPNPIDTQIFSQQDTTNYKKELGVADDDFVLAFGAVGGKLSKIKGYDLLVDALKLLSNERCISGRMKLVVFGGKTRLKRRLQGFESIEVGHISQEQDLALLYSTASITVVPSRVESFGQVAAESLSCQTPVVAFNYSGITDIVDHQKTGYLAEPFDVESLASGILWFYNLSLEERKIIGVRGRESIKKRFDSEVVAKQYIILYRKISADNLGQDSVQCNQY